MAARKNRGADKLSDNWKSKIQASALMNRLADCSFGNIEMTNAQIRAADIVLKKILPDLARTETKHEGEMGLNVNINYPGGHKPTL